MKIVYTLLGLGVAGGIRIVIEHCNRLADRGHTVTLVPLMHQGDLPKADEFWMPLRCGLAKPKHLEALAKAADVVIATEANTAEPVVELETKAKKYYFIQMRESLFFLYGDPLWAGKVEMNYKRFKGVLKPIVISWWLKDFLEKIYGYEDVPIVPNGVNTETFYPDPAYPKGQVPRVLIEGHTHGEAKDIGGLSFQTVDAFKRMIGPVEVWGVSQLEPQYPFDHFVQMAGQEEMRKLYSSCDVLLKASRYEGRGCVDVEAMACGCAVNRAIIFGEDDLIHGYNCMKVQYGDFQGFFNHLVAMLKESTVRSMLAANGLRYVKENLDWDPFIDRLETIYSGEQPEPLPRTYHAGEEDAED